MGLPGCKHTVSWEDQYLILVDHFLIYLTLAGSWGPPLRSIQAMDIVFLLKIVVFIIYAFSQKL